MRSYPGLFDRTMDAVRVDLRHAHRVPAAQRVVLATVLAVVASLLVDAILVAVGTAIFPSTAGYPHFQFSDYAKLTVVGVVFACAGWPVVTYVSFAPRWLYSRLAVLATLVLYLPDLYLLARGQPTNAVAVLMAMHLAVVLIIYYVVVSVAPAPKPLPHGATSSERRHSASA